MVNKTGPLITKTVVNGMNIVYELTLILLTQFKWQRRNLFTQMVLWLSLLASLNSEIFTLYLFSQDPER